jgi:hypothetical protein
MDIDFSSKLGARALERLESDDPLAPEDLEGYLAKYRARIESTGYTPEQMRSIYSVPIEMQLTRVRGL